MRAIVVSSPGEVSLDVVTDPTPASDDVILRVESVGICGTDLHIISGDYVAEYPIIPGHEFAGRIVETGSDVTGLKIGDTVTADPNIYCGQCRRCSSGRENMCLTAAAVGVTRTGAAAEYVAVPAANCVRVAGTTLSDASLVEPLSCALHGMDVIGTVAARNVLIYGAGPMGLMLLSLATAAGAGYVGVVDLNEDRLSIARQLGASGAARAADRLRSPEEFNIVIDCTGVPAVIEAAIEIVAPGGTFLQFGVTPRDRTVAIRPERILMDEITITGARAVKRSFERAAGLFGEGILDASVLITHRYPLDRYQEALDTVRRGDGLKVHLIPGRDDWPKELRS